MNIQLLASILGWSALINYCVLLLWFLFFIFAHDWMYNLHGIWFKLSRENFDTIHYAGMAGFKLLIFTFNLGPFLAILIFM